MPSVKPKETKSKYMSRCVPTVKGEGKKTNQAVAQCLSMFKKKWTAKK